MRDERSAVAESGAKPGWRRARVAPSLAEVYRTVPVTGRSWWRKALAFAGPGYLIAVGYMDPGNWATDLAGGSAYGYTLLSVVLISNLLAVLLQALAAELRVPSGFGGGRSRAPAVARHHAKPVDAVHRDRHPGRHRHAAQSLPPLVHRADPSLRGDQRGQAGGDSLRDPGLDGGPLRGVLHQR